MLACAHVIGPVLLDAIAIRPPAAGLCCVFKQSGSEGTQSVSHPFPTKQYTTHKKSHPVSTLTTTQSLGSAQTQQRTARDRELFGGQMCVVVLAASETKHYAATNVVCGCDVIIDVIDKSIRPNRRTRTYKYE